VLENCSCATVCPGHFSFRNRCTHDYCHALWAFHTTDGLSDGTPLGGLSAIIMAATPPYMIEGGWKVALYVDERASDAQARTLDGIFTGRLGGPWSLLDRFVGERFPTRKVPIHVERAASGRLRAVSVPGVLASEVDAIRGHDKKSEAMLVNLFNTLYEPVHIIGRGTFEYRDHGFDWRRADQPSHGLLTTFDWSVATA
jgi:hypothetical protein